MKNLTEIKKQFKNKDLFDQSLTHRSWVNENPEKRESNERLEFLGDAVVEFVVSEKLFERLPDKNEGYLTALRANLVNTKNLSEIAKKLEIGKEIFLSKGESDGGGRTNHSLLADTVEAIIGAIFIDQGIKKASDFIGEHILSNVEEILAKPLKDPKSRLQELIQSKGLPAPRYKVIKTFGPDHAKEFRVQVEVKGKILGTGEGKSKSLAQQEAANKALELEKEPIKG